MESPILARLEGEWAAVQVVRDGQELPAMMLPTGLRSAQKNEVRISFGGQLMIHALVRVDDHAEPIQVDYYNLAGANQGLLQAGIMEWVDGDACFCMAAPSQPRPTDFESAAGSGRTFSRWRPKTNRS